MDILDLDLSFFNDQHVENRNGCPKSLPALSVRVANFYEPVHHSGSVEFDMFHFFESNHSISRRDKSLFRSEYFLDFKLGIPLIDYSLAL